MFDVFYHKLQTIKNLGIVKSLNKNAVVCNCQISSSLLNFRIIAMERKMFELSSELRLTHSGARVNV